MVLKSSRYLTTSFNTIPQPHTNEQQQQQEDEFNECDIIWSYDDNNNNPIYPNELGSDTEGKIYAILPQSIPTSTTTTTGLSAALEDPIKSPTSIQRKTTSSPAVSMISSSLTRGGTDNGPSGPGYYSYGRKFHQSAPVNVPLWPNGLGKRRTNGPGLGLGDEFGLGSFDENEEMEMVPPHEIVARSHSNSNRMSFSVMEGAGRTLKGRDLTTVRNAVFHKTGFL